jgi:hypothetical protein
MHEHVGALSGAVDGLVVLLLADTALLDRLLRTVNTSMALLTAVLAFACERTLSALVGARGLDMTA